MDDRNAVEVTATRPTAPARAAYNYAVGYLRGSAILLVIVGHSFLGYYPGPFPFPEHVRRMAYPVLDPHRFKGSRTFNGFDDIYLMALIFFLSGLFVLGSLRRKGAGGYLRDRMLRLGLPFLVSALVVSGIAYYPSYLQSHPAGGGSLANYFATWQTPLQWMSGAAWFIGALLLYDCVLSAVQAFAPGILDWISKLCAGSNDTLRFYALVVGLSAIAYLPMVVIFGAYDWFNLGPFWIQKCRVLLYGLYFFLGAGVGGAGLSTSLAAPGSNLAKRWYAWAIAAILVFLVAGNLQLLSLNHHTYDDPLWRLIVGVGWILSCATSAFALLAIFVRFANTPNRVFESLSTNSYGMYLTHYAMVTWTQYALLASSIPPLTKALAVIAVAAAGSWLLTMALRWIPAVARII